MNEDRIYPSMVIRSQAEAIELLEKENQELKEKLNQYENPDDLTLFYMWLDEKAKDKMKQLQTENQQLTNERNTMACLVNDLQETLEEIREVVKETLELKEEYPEEVECVVNDLLQVIDKGVNNDL